MKRTAPGGRVHPWPSTSFRLNGGWGTPPQITPHRLNRMPLGIAQHFAPPNSSDTNGQLTGNQINRMFGQTPGGGGQMDFSLPSAADLTPMLGTGQGAFAGPGGSGSAAPGMFDDPFDTLFAQQHLWADGELPRHP